MKLKNIYTLCKKHRDTINNISISKEPYPLKGRAMRIIYGSNYGYEAINELSQIECLKNDINKLKDYFLILEYNDEKALLDCTSAKTMVKKKEELVAFMDNIIKLHSSLYQSDNVLGIDIKIPQTKDFTEFKKYISELEYIFMKCPFFKINNEMLQFQSIDIGSTWLTLSVKTSILLAIVANFLNNAMIIRSHYLTCQQQKLMIEKEQMDKKNKEVIIDYITTVYKRSIDASIQELEEISGHYLEDGDERGRTELAFEKMNKLIDQGLQIYSTIDSPQEIKALFKPIEQQFLSIQEVSKLIEDKENENND